MKNIGNILWLLAIMVLAGPGMGRAGMGETSAVPPLTLSVDLSDGSRLVGTPGIKSLAVQTPYAKLEIALDQVRSVTVARDRESAAIELANGDRVNGALILKTLVLQTAFGKFSIGLEQMVKIDVTSGKALKRELLTGLVLYYSFDKDESGWVADLSAKGNNGLLHGTAWIPQGKIGGAREFNGISDYISLDYNEKNQLFPTDGPLSVAVWFKTSAAVPIQQVLVATHYAGMGRDGYILEINARSFDGKAVWSPAIPGIESTKSQAAVNDGQWHHAVGVWDGRQSSLYLDGVPQGASQAIGAFVYTHRAPFRIGHAANNNAPYARDEYYYFKGAMDEVMVFKRALSETDVKALFSAHQ